VLVSELQNTDYRLTVLSAFELDTGLHMTHQIWVKGGRSKPATVISDVLRARLSPAHASMTEHRYSMRGVSRE